MRERRLEVLAIASLVATVMTMAVGLAGGGLTVLLVAVIVVLALAVSVGAVAIDYRLTLRQARQYPPARPERSNVRIIQTEQRGTAA